jgi:hypothetical protein
MASNRSRARERSAALVEPTETPSQALKALARPAACIQIASCSAAAIKTTLSRTAADHIDTRLARASINN